MAIWLQFSQAFVMSWIVICTVSPEILKAVDEKTTKYWINLLNFYVTPVTRDGHVMGMWRALRPTPIYGYGFHIFCLICIKFCRDNIYDILNHSEKFCGYITFLSWAMMQISTVWRVLHEATPSFFGLFWHILWNFKFLNFFLIFDFDGTVNFRHFYSR